MCPNGWCPIGKEVETEDAAAEGFFVSETAAAGVGGETKISGIGKNNLIIQ